MAPAVACGLVMLMVASLAGGVLMLAASLWRRLECPRHGDVGARALALWAGVWVLSECMRQWTPWQGGYGELSLLAADLPGVAAWLPLVGARAWSWMWLLLACLTVGVVDRTLTSGPMAAARSAAIAIALGALLMAPVAPGHGWTREQPITTAVALHPEDSGPWTAAQRDHRVDQLLRAARGRAPDTVLVTSEGFFAEPPPAQAQGVWLEMVDALAAQQVHALVGAGVMARGDRAAGEINAVLQLSPDRQSLYGKGRLAPGGESLPWLALLRPVYQQVFARDSGELLVAPETWRTPLFVGGTSMALALCHEIAFDADVATRSREAEVIVSPAYDGWIRDSGYRWQARALARLRAMETGKPVLRVSEGGESLLAAPDGGVLPLLSAGVVVEAVAIRPHLGQTPFAGVAGAIPWLPWGGLALWTLILPLRALWRGGRRSVIEAPPEGGRMEWSS